MIATRLLPRLSAAKPAASAFASSSRLPTSSRAFSSSAISLANTLLYLEHRKGTLNPSSLVALTAAKKVGGDIHAFVAGDEGVKDVADKASKVEGVSKIFTSESPKYKGLHSEPIVPVLKSLVEKNSYTHVFAGHTAIGKDVIPRLAALLDVSQVSDIIAVESEDTFQRPIYAGNAIATVKSSDKIKIITVRGTAFDKAAEEGGSASIEEVSDAEAADAPTTFVEEKINQSSRPDLATAPRVVSGGRALKSADGFKKYIEPLADQLNAAVGASRAAVDAGYADNALQVGQTGKIIAPELYVAVGISGAIQHLAGMKDAKTISAINKDPDAPIFQVADVGLVADLYEAVPEMMEKLKK
ncbi:electron transfer flavo protein, alpha subunit [Jaminaea rosea]|uniref:Probable electron transfer flavoprotein subunit alpha n=1 Tax=Jaminaea rosea TaxID=1569628 RepID=A0A316UW17_9BASI|nr:electron transfer flavo protein, alpha subunit [Jaminaea rosea]PWN29486.1 electron transfer flavo protein, alpha subunit [Jaminaea rosea]